MVVEEKKGEEKVVRPSLRRSMRKERGASDWEREEDADDHWHGPFAICLFGRCEKPSTWPWTCTQLLSWKAWDRLYPINAPVRES